MSPLCIPAISLDPCRRPAYQLCYVSDTTTEYTRHTFISGVRDEAHKPGTLWNNLSLFQSGGKFTPMLLNAIFAISCWQTHAGHYGLKFTFVKWLYSTFRIYCCCCNFSMSCQPHPRAWIVQVLRQTLGSERNAKWPGVTAAWTLTVKQSLL